MGTRCGQIDPGLVLHLLEHEGCSVAEVTRLLYERSGLLGLCSTFLYYSRHILPYDTAMAFGLLALFAGLRTPLRAVDSVACGFLAASAFLTYNGCWTLAATHAARAEG